MKFGFNINLKNSPDEIIQLGEKELSTGNFQAVEITYHENLDGIDTFPYNKAHRLRFIFQILMLLNKIQPFVRQSCMNFMSAANMFIRLVEVKLSCTMALSEGI